MNESILGLRVIIATLLRSLSMVKDVLVVTAICIFIFALLGLQLFQGSLHQICVENPVWPDGLKEDSQIDAFYSQWISDQSMIKITLLNF